MRVASTTLFNLSASRINQVKSDLLDANTKVTTGKKINTLSDDPVAVSSIMNLKSSISGLEQYSQNLAVGRRWLQSGEATLSSVKDLIIDAKTSAIAMQKGGLTDVDYRTGASEIKGILDQIITLANTMEGGQYIFSGTKTDIKPFSPDDEDNPTAVNYDGGLTPYSVKMSGSTNLEVSYSGHDVFENSYIIINDTNNKIDFREDPAGSAVEYGAELTAEIPAGKYTHKELAAAMSTVMTARSAAVNQPEIVNVSQNNATFNVSNYNALSVPTGALPVTLTYTAATNSWAVTNDPGYVPPIAVHVLSSGDSEVYMDFNGDNVTDVTAKFDSPVADGYSVSFDITPAAAGGNGVTYNVDYNEGTRKFSIAETGGPVLDNLQMMWATGINKDTSIAPDIGFDVSANLTGPADGTTHVSDKEVNWGIFNTLIDLQTYLINKDTAGINRTLSRISTDFEVIGSVEADMGIKQNRLDIRDNIIGDLNISYTGTKSTLEDTDMISEITKLEEKQFAYNAALSSTSKVIKMSLLDYL